MQHFVVALAVITALAVPAAAWLTLRRRRRAGPAAAVAGMRERDFEVLVAAAFQAQGYEPVSAGAAAATAGQLALRRERTTFLVECRHFKIAKVEVDAVQALQRAMAVRGATAGFVLSGGRFSREAIAFAGGCGIRLVDGPVLDDMLGHVKAR